MTRGAALPSLDELQKSQRDALSEWQRSQDVTPLLEAWSGIHVAVASTAAPERFLGHLAVLWQELNGELDSAADGTDSLALLNQFVVTTFPGINAWVPPTFAPSLALDAPSWHPALCRAVRRVVESEAGTSERGAAERHLDALSAQYGNVFRHSLRPRVRELIVEQVGELERAASLCTSGLIALEDVDWDAQSVPAQSLLELLGAIAAVSVTRDDLQWLQGTDSDQGTAAQQVLGYWASHAGWFERFLRRRTGNWLLDAYSTPPLRPATGPALRTGCDAHVLLVAPADLASRWLLAAEAAPATRLRLRAEPGPDLEALRQAWSAAAASVAVRPSAALSAERQPRSLCRLIIDELPPRYFERGPKRGAAATEPDPVRRLDEQLDVEPPAAAIALFELGTLAQADFSVYVKAAAQLAAQRKREGDQAESFTWYIVFDGANGVLAGDRGTSMASSRALDEHDAAVRGLTSPPLELSARSSPALVRVAMSHPCCRRSPAFARRVARDLQAVMPFLRTLLDQGVGTIGVAYTDSHPGVSHEWPSFAQGLEAMERRVVGVTRRRRHEYLRQRFVARLMVDVRGEGTLGGRRALEPLLDRLGSTLEVEPTPAAPHLPALWEELMRAVRRASPIMPGSFDGLWHDTESRRQRLREAVVERRQGLVTLLSEVLAELGIPATQLGELHRSSGAQARAPALDPGHWQALLRLVGEPQPVSADDPELATLPLVVRADESQRGVARHGCILKDHEIDGALRSLFHHHPGTTVLEFVCDTRVPLDERIRLLITLRGYQPNDWRASVGSRTRRDALRAELMLLHLARSTLDIHAALAHELDTPVRDRRYRQDQLKRLLDVAGWAPMLGADAPAAQLALRRVILHWKDFYRSRRIPAVLSGAKRAHQCTKALLEDYTLLYKPASMPVLEHDLPLEQAEELERSAYLAACVLELLERLDEPSPADTKEGERNAFSGFSELSVKTRALLDHYAAAKARCLVHDAAVTLNDSQWLAGNDPSVATVGARVLNELHRQPAALAKELSNAVERALAVDSAELEHHAVGVTDGVGGQPSSNAAPSPVATGDPRDGRRAYH